MTNKRFDESGYQRKLRDPRWQQRRLFLLEQAQWKCQDSDCNRTDKPLEIHHVYYERGKEPWDYPDGTFLVLCEDCHEKRGEIERTIKRMVCQSLRDFPISKLELAAEEFVSELIHKASSDDEAKILRSFYEDQEWKAKRNRENAARLKEGK